MAKNSQTQRSPTRKSAEVTDTAEHGRFNGESCPYCGEPLEDRGYAFSFYGCECDEYIREEFGYRANKEASAV